MWGQALWFWPLLFVIPTAVVVVIRANQSAAWQSRTLRLLALLLFSYAFYYFALSWPVWLTQLSWVKRLAVSSLVPVGVLLVLAVLPLDRPMDALAIQKPIPSFMFWFIPGQVINEKLDSAVWTSPRDIPLWEARQKGFHSYVTRHAFLPDGRILILGGMSKPGRDVSGAKLTRLLPDGSIDPAFKGHEGCVRGDGLFLPQADGRGLVLFRQILSPTPYAPTKLALVLSPEGEEEREISIPKLPPEQIVWGYVAELQLEPDGGLMAYGNFSGKNMKFQSFRLRFTAQGAPDLSSGAEVPGLESHHPEAITRDADGRFFISYDNPRADGLGFFTLTAEGRPEEAFQARLLETQREHGLLRGRALAPRADGKLIAVFEKRAVKYEVVRLHLDGSLDTSFQRTELPFEANHVSVSEGGSIFVARVRNSDEGSPLGPVELMRLGPDGGVDEAVTQRMREACASQEVKGLHGLAVKPDGTVLLYRPVSSSSREEKLRLLVQLRPDGSLDPHFQPPF